jgi:hypothetical protein
MELGQETVQITKTFINTSYGWMDDGGTWASITVADIQPQYKRNPTGNNFVGTHVTKINCVNPDGSPNTELARQVADTGKAIFGKAITLHCLMETGKSGMNFKCIGVSYPEFVEQKQHKATA